MAVTGRDKACFFVYTKYGHHLELIELDRGYWCNEILEKLKFCWKNYLAPTLLGKQRLTLNLPNSDPSTSSNQKTKNLKYQNFASWKSPGKDSLENFWWSKFELIHDNKTKYCYIYLINSKHYSLVSNRTL